MMPDGGTAPVAALRAGAAHAAMRAFPLATLEALTGGEAVLVLAPHPDDESLGCGGLIAASVAAGRPASVLVMTDGAASHPNSIAHPPARMRATREAEAIEAVRRLGLPPSRIGFLGLSDAAAPVDGDAFEAAVRAILERAAAQGCRVLAAPWIGDPHCDHEAVQLMARAAARRAGLRLLSYPVWGWTLPPDAEIPGGGALAGHRLDIAAHRAAKRHAIAAHVSQYGALVTDDPTGFTLPARLLDPCDQPWEVFIETRP